MQNLLILALTFKSLTDVERCDPGLRPALAASTQMTQDSLNTEENNETKYHIFKIIGNKTLTRA